MSTVRLLFEPQPGTCVNHATMFEHYASNYLSDFNFSFGGHISMDLMDKVGDAMEPVWQFIDNDVSTVTMVKLDEYLKRNPMEGYHVHLYNQEPGKNAQHIFNT